MADCHLGGWRQKELQDLNFKSFQFAIDKCISEKVDFVLVAGDLFDSAYPPIEILKESFAEFKKLHDAKIPVYLIAGSHDFSASGKTFLDVLEKAGFCKNVEDWEYQEDGTIKLKPSFYEDIAIYGYPGRKSGMEIEDLRKVRFDSLNQFSIFMIHTTIEDVVGSIPMESISKNSLPLANYYAMGHIHQIFTSEEKGSVYGYPGPIFPNNFQELMDLKMGSFNIVNVNGFSIKVENVKIPLREVAAIEVSISDALSATQDIIRVIDKFSLYDKIVLLKLKGTLVNGKTGDIQFDQIEDFVYKKGAFVFLRNISSIKVQDFDLEIDETFDDNFEEIESKVISEYSAKNPTDFNKYMPYLMNALSMEKNEDEKSAVYEDRLISELKDVLEVEDIL